MPKMSYLASILLFYLIIITNSQSTWYSPQFSSSHNDREELAVVDAVSDQNFTAGNHVYRWHNLKAGKRDFAVGLMDSEVTILVSEEVKEERRFRTTSQVINLETLVTDAALFENWNNDLGTSEVVCIISTVESLLWFKILQNATLVKIDTWKISQPINHLNFFIQDRRYKLLTITTSKSKTTADIYEFRYDTKLQDIWQIQRLYLSNPTNSTTFINSGPNDYLAIPQKSLNLLLIYKYSDNHFESFKNISCFQADQVVSFRINSKAYLALAGEDGDIYHFTKSDLIKTTPENYFSGVNFFQTIPVKNFRNDILILAQRTLQHDSHTSLSLELFLQQQKGSSFVAHDEVTCCFHGETSNGLTCLSDEERSEGVVGMTVVSLGRSLGLLVPRGKGPSAMVMLEVKLKEVENPVEEQMRKFRESRKKLEEILERKREQKQAKMMEENLVEASFNQGLKRQVSEKNSGLKDLEEKLKEIRQQIAEMKENLKHRMDVSSENKTTYYNTIIFNGDVDVTGKITVTDTFTDNINGEDSQKILDDIVIRDEIKPIPSKKTFTNLHVEKLQTKRINGLQSSDLMFLDENPLQIKGDVVFSAPVSITNELISTSGKVNDFVLENELVQPEKIHNDALKFREIHVLGVVQVNRVEEKRNLDLFSVGEDGRLPELIVQSLEAPLDVTVGNVNGVNFDEFLKTLCLKNVESHIRGDVSVSSLIVSGNSHTNYLNGLKFPEEYIFATANRTFTTITGTKTFTKPVRTTDIIINDKINGFMPNDLITLDLEQIIPKTVEFSDLEVTEKFDYEGKIVGPQNFANDKPTLTEADHLSCNINFEDLEVTGKVIISNTLNKTNFAQSLQDIVYKDELNPKITSQKIFNKTVTVLNSVQIETDTINKIPLESFITTNTQQILDIRKLNASVTFGNLFISGLYQGFNLVKLEEETIKTYGHQYVRAKLIFLDEPTVPAFRVTETLNEIDVEEFVSTSDDIKQLNAESFGRIEADSVTVFGNAFTDISNFDLDAFDSHRVSLTKHQLINASYSFEEVEVNAMKADFINGRAYDYLFETRSFAQEIANRLHAGQLHVKELHVNGSVVIDEINGFDLDSLMMKGSWRGRVLESGSNLVCMGDVTFGHLQFEIFNNVKFYDFANTLVYKTQPDIELSGLKIFNNGFAVNKYIETEKINGIYLGNILRNSGEQSISSPLNIKGNVEVTCNATVSGNLNGVSLNYIADSFELSEDGYKINGDVYFDRNIYIKSLYLKKYVNGVFMSEYIKKIVDRKGDYNFTGRFTFEKQVNITGNLATGAVNAIDVSGLESSAVFLTNDAEIEGLITFNDFVFVNNQLKIQGNLDTEYLDGVDLENWKTKAAYIDGGLLRGNFTFENVDVEEYLSTAYINGVNVKNLVTRNTEQHIPGKLTFTEVSVYNDIPVGNLVNGVKLENFIKSNLINGTDQEISSQISFTNNAIIYESLVIDDDGTINGLHFDKLVTTSTDQNLSAVYVFEGESNSIERSLRIYRFLNDINVTDWFSNALKKYSNETQYINSEIDIDGDLTFVRDVGGNGSVNGLDFPSVVGALEERKRKKYGLEKDTVEEFQKVCSDVNFAVHFARNQIFAFKYLENLQTLSFPSLITNIYNFMNNGIHYLLVSEEADCMSHFFVWTENQFRYSSSKHMGLIFQVISVNKLDGPYIVTLSPEDSDSCHFNGANIWRITDNTVEHMYQLDKVLLLQESKLKGTFYVYGEEGVVEYRFNPKRALPLRKHRKWLIRGDNLAFVPRGLQTGLAMRNGEKIFRLTSDNLIYSDEGSDSVHIGSIEEIENPFIPGRSGGEIAIMKIGPKYDKRTLLAVTTHDETRVPDSLDLIRIHDDALTGSLFQNVAVYKPSSPIFVDFNNGESLLLFLENQKVLQVYEYKGIEGFKHRSSSSMEGEKLFVTQLPLKPYKNPRQIIGVVNGNEIKFLESVMMGNHYEGNEFDCEL